MRNIRIHQNMHSLPSIYPHNLTVQTLRAISSHIAQTNKSFLFKVIFLNDLCIAFLILQHFQEFFNYMPLTTEVPTIKSWQPLCLDQSSPRFKPQNSNTLEFIPDHSPCAMANRFTHIFPNHTPTSTTENHQLITRNYPANEAYIET